MHVPVCKQNSSHAVRKKIGARNVGMKKLPSYGRYRQMCCRYSAKLSVWYEFGNITYFKGKLQCWIFWCKMKYLLINFWCFKHKIFWFITRWFRYVPQKINKIWLCLRNWYTCTHIFFYCFRNSFVKPGYILRGNKSKSNR